MATQTFSIGGLHCQGCVNSVQGILRQQHGVKDANVDLASGQAHVEIADDFDATAAIQAVAKAGFTMQAA